MKEFKANEYITLKLESNKTVIYIKDKKFIQCKYLLLGIPIKEISSFDDIESIDEAAENLDRSLESGKKIQIPPETEFWGHCSNLQVWAENNYNTRLLHRNIAFPLLKRLTEVGDPKAKKVIKEEIANRFSAGNPSVITYILNQGYLKYLSKEEIAIIFEEFDFTKIIILEYDVALPLLKKLNKTGVPIAKRVLKEEIVKRVDSGNVNIITYLYNKNYLEFFTKEEKYTLLESIYSDIKSEQAHALIELGLILKQVIPRANKVYRETFGIKIEGDNVVELGLYFESLKSLPESIGNLKSLQKLDLSYNKLTTLPESIGNLSSLQTLDLHYNEFTILPESIIQLEYLQELDLRGNQLMTLPESISNLKSLINLKLHEFREKEFMEIFEIFKKKSKSEKIPTFEEFKRNVDKFIELTIDAYISNMGSKREAIQKWIDYIGSEDIAHDYFRAVDSWNAYT